MEERLLAVLAVLGEAAVVAVLAVVVRLEVEAMALRSRAMLAVLAVLILAPIRLEEEVAVLAVLERNQQAHHRLLRALAERARLAQLPEPLYYALVAVEEALA